MSLDFTVYLHSEPSEDILKGIYRAEGLSIENSEGADTDEVDLVFRDSDGEHWINVLGPFAVLAEDLPEIDSPELNGSRWLLELSTGFSDAVALDKTLRLAERLVDRFGGALYDSQSGAVTYPTVVARDESRDRTIRMLTLRWFFESDGFLPDKVLVFLDCLKRLYPECLPKAFGFQPLKYQYVVGEEERFIDDLHKASRESSGSVYWRPVSSSINCTMNLQPGGHSEGRPCTSIEIYLDCAELEKPAELARVEKLFIAVSVELESFYAGAFVTRNVHITDRELGLGFDTERLGEGPGAVWNGIPDVPTWLTWFGDTETRAKIADSLDDRYLSHDGRLMKIGDRPLDSDELRGLFPRLPDSVVNPDTGPWTVKRFGM